MANTNEFLLSNHTSTSGTGGHWWRGYHFQVSEPIEVYSLYGGGTGEFMVGLFEVNSNVVPQNLLRVGTVSSGRLRKLEVSPVELIPGKDYLIAQQRSGSGSHYHYTVSSFSSSSVESHEKISYFRPSGNCYRWHNSGTSSTYIIGRSYGSTNSTRPDLGFGYFVTSGNFYAVRTEDSWININNMSVFAEPSVWLDEDFNLVNYSGIGGTGGYYWRGYAFEPEVNMHVSGIICGATTGNFQAGLYEASGTTPTSVIESVISPSERGVVVDIPSVILEAGQRYIIAQGRAAHTHTGNHYTVERIDADGIENTDLFKTWLPSNGASNGDCYRWTSTGNDTYIVGRNYNDVSSIRPHLGLIIESETDSYELSWQETEEVYVMADGSWETVS